jgi:hypothetical protein
MASAGRLTDYDLARSGTPTPCEAVPSSGRLKLWEIGGGFHCSILGTCLATPDLKALARKLHLTPPAHATDYEIHGYFVQQATQEGAVARALQRLLDHRYEGALRRVSRATETAALDALWEDFKASGRIAGGYWALLTHRHVPNDLRARVFGEVHMMSHLQGAAVRDHASRADQLERDNSELRDRLARIGRSAQEAQAAVDERDRRVAILSERLTVAEAAGTRTEPVRTSADRLERKLAKRERSLVGARTRARDLEAEVDRLNREISALRHKQQPQSQAPLPVDDLSPLLPPRVPGGACRLLYVGGRPGLVPHLRDVAERRQASFEHHDGGKEETLQRIDDLVERADAVLCPVDCISHSACLRVKHLCQRHSKLFLPLKSASRSCFARALMELGLTPAPAPEAGDRTVAG